MNLSTLIKQLIPPVLIGGYHRFLHSQPRQIFGLTGDYQTWEEARVNSTGYDTPFILEKTKDAMLKVVRGEAKYERDSVLLDEIQISWPLVASLMWIAAQKKGELNLLDFGGALGSTYYQNRIFLEKLPSVRWNIIEQSGHVGVGKQYFENKHVFFYPGLEECYAATSPRVLLMSSVLQYLEKPFEEMIHLLRPSIEFLVLDRTPFWEGPADRICVQKVPPEIYPASYPSWIFSHSQFRKSLEKTGFGILAEFENADWMPAPVPFKYKGMLAVRNAVQG